MKETSNRFNSERPRNNSAELYRLYGELDEDALYQQRHYLRSLKNPTQQTVDKINYINGRIAFIKSRQPLEE